MARKNLNFKSAYLLQTQGGEPWEYEEEVAAQCLEEFAALLKGEVDGRNILCASPGFPDDDRSCCVRINPDHPETLFVYYCEGPVGRAYVKMKAMLGIRDQQSDNAENTALAKAIWDDTVPAPGTIVETYLRSRAITLPIPDCIRFHGALKHISGGTWPAMVTAVTRGDDAFSAIHRTFLRYDGKGKAPVKPEKVALGPTGGCSARLSAVAPKLVVGEGIETTLSAMQLSGLPGWSGLSAPGLRAMILPTDVRAVAIAADVDEKGWGERAAQEAARRFIFEGRNVGIARPLTGKDFNDVLVAQVRP